MLFPSSCDEWRVTIEWRMTSRRPWPPTSELAQICPVDPWSPMLRYMELQKFGQLAISYQLQGRAGQCRAWQGMSVRPCEAGRGRAGQDRAGQSGKGRAGQGMTGQGRACRAWQGQGRTRGVISTFFLGGPKIFLNFSMPPDYWKNWKKQHFICSNLTLFIVPFNLSFFFSPFFLFFFPFLSFFFFSFFSFFFFLGGGGRRPPQPPSNDAPGQDTTRQGMAWEGRAEQDYTEVL